MTNTNYPELSDLLGTYFHQDWHAEFATDDVALRAMVSGEDAERLRIASKEIEILLHASPEGSDLTIVVSTELGCFFNPLSRGLTAREWLLQAKRWFDTAN